MHSFLVSLKKMSVFSNNINFTRSLSKMSNKKNLKFLNYWNITDYIIIIFNSSSFEFSPGNNRRKIIFFSNFRGGSTWYLDLKLATCMQSEPNHWCEFEYELGRCVQHYVIQFVSELRQVGDFLQVLLLPPSIKLTATK